MREDSICEWPLWVSIPYCLAILFVIVAAGFAACEIFRRYVYIVVFKLPFWFWLGRVWSILK